MHLFFVLGRINCHFPAGDTRSWLPNPGNQESPQCFATTTRRSWGVEWIKWRPQKWNFETWREVVSMEGREFDAETKTFRWVGCNEGIEWSKSTWLSTAQVCWLFFILYYRVSEKNMISKQRYKSRNIVFLFFSFFCLIHNNTKYIDYLNSIILILNRTPCTRFHLEAGGRWHRDNY